MKQNHEIIIEQINELKILIGIVEGMGSLASDFYRKLLTRAFLEGGGKTEHDIASTISWSNPQMPRKDKSVEGGKDKELLFYLYEAMDFFIKNNATFIVAPCNTLMFYKKELEEHIKSKGKIIPILDIIQLTAKATHDTFPEVKKVGLISTKATADKGLYDSAFEPYDTAVIKLDDYHQAIAIAVLEAIKRGEHHHTKRKTELLEMIGRCNNYLESKGAQAIVLGCTEFPLLVNNKNKLIGKVPLISSTNCLVRGTVDKYKELVSQQNLQQNLWSQWSEKELNRQTITNNHISGGPEVHSLVTASLTSSHEKKINYPEPKTSWANKIELSKSENTGKFVSKL